MNTSEEQRITCERLVQLVRNLGYGQATAGDDLLGLGLGSLEILLISVDIERESGRPVDLEVLLAAESLSELAEQLSRTGA
jgi:phosphopantetheine binding protein